MTELYLWILLGLLVLSAIRITIRKWKKGGGCCGEHEAAVRISPVRDRSKAHYPYVLDLRITGMTCINCARRIENALNSMDGIWAEVDKSSGKAHILSRQKLDERKICSFIAGLGYFAERIG